VKTVIVSANATVIVSVSAPPAMMTEIETGTAEVVTVMVATAAETIDRLGTVEKAGTAVGSTNLLQGATKKIGDDLSLEMIVPEAGYPVMTLPNEVVDGRGSEVLLKDVHLLQKEPFPFLSAREKHQAGMCMLLAMSNTQPYKQNRPVRIKTCLFFIPI
jgi:hypothetical protein